MGPYGDGTYYIAQATMMTNRVLHGDLGFAFADAVPATFDEREVDVSLERIDEIADADLILLRTNPRSDGTGVDEKQTRNFTESALWQQLPAVRRGQSYPIPGALFYISPLTAAANLDWAEDTLLG